jgi:hypothetical protein
MTERLYLTTTPPAPSASPWLLATEAPSRLLCWPDWASAQDLGARVDRFGKPPPRGGGGARVWDPTRIP